MTYVLFSAAPAPSAVSFSTYYLFDYFITLETQLIVFYATIVCSRNFPQLRPCLLAHLSLVWRPLFVEQHGAFSFELCIDCQSDSLGVAVGSHGHRDERGESGE